MHWSEIWLLIGSILLVLFGIVWTTLNIKKNNFRGLIVGLGAFVLGLIFMFLSIKL